MSIIEKLISLIAPHHCVGCNLEGTLLCKKCTNNLHRPVINTSYSNISAIITCAIYDNSARTLVRRLKYGRCKAAAKVIAPILAKSLPEGEWIIAHVPTTPPRARMRGYDQAEIIAKQLSVLTLIPRVSLLERNGKHHQVGNTAKMRQLQMSNAYRPLRSAILKNKNILLIDDVVTTGSSMTSAAKTLRKVGAKQVVGLAFARAL